MKLRYGSALFFTAFLILLVVISAQKTALFLDPDFGWHMRTGEYILEHGIPRTDPFSYSMPSFPIVPPSWAGDVLFASLYPRIGYSGLSWILAVVGVVSLVMALAPFHPFKKPWSIIPLSLGFSALLPYMSVRPQTFSWLFFAATSLIILEPKRWKKFRFALPLVMLIWVNIHASFALGLAFLVFRYLHMIYAKQKVSQTDWLILLTTFAVTLVNPYGIHLWREVILTFTDNKLRMFVNEWSPLILRLTLHHIPILMLSLVFAIRFYSTLPRLLTDMFFILLILGLSSSKLFPFWTIMAIYLMAYSITRFEKTLIQNRDKASPARLSLFLAIISIFSIGTLLLRIPSTWSTYEVYKEETYYPQKAIQFIQENPIQQNMLTSFGWGGYILWKLPGQKNFVDGHMAYWRMTPRNNFESSDAFSEYHSLIKGQIDVKKTFEKYNINTVLLPKHDVYVPMQEFVGRMSRFEWNVVYEDDIAIIYARPE